MGRISKKKIARAVVVVAAAVAIFVPVQNAMRKQLGIRSAKEEAALQDEDLQAYAEANGLTDEEALNALGIGKSVKEREKEEEQVMSHLEPVDENHGYTDEEIRTTPSDIDGMTLQDKKDAGLDWWIEGSDSDGDGLTDKEEIEKYHSDPLKYSTSGDLYSDKYKADHKMDFSKAYEYEGKQEYINNECANVTLNAETADSLEHGAAIKDENGFYYVEGVSIIEVYRFARFTGTATIDLTDTLAENNLSMKDISLYNGTYTDMKLEDYTVDGNKVSIHVNGSLSVVVAKKDKAKNPWAAFGAAAWEVPENAPKAKITLQNQGETFDAFCYDIKILNLIGNRPTIYYTTTGDKDLDKKMLKPVIEDADIIADGEFLRTTPMAVRQENYEIGYNICKEVNQTQLDAVRGLVSHLPFSTDLKRDKHDSLGMVYFSADRRDYWATLTSDYEKQGGIQNDSGFKVGEDAFAFKNFRTEASNGGNCLGISLYTARLFNNKTVPASGSWEIQDYMDIQGPGTISWDISKNAENATLLDPGIHDYLSSDFTKTHETKKIPITDENGNVQHDKEGNIQYQYVLGNLTEGQQEFVNMITGYREEACRTFEWDGNYYEQPTTSRNLPDTLFDKINKAIASKKILILSMEMQNRAALEKANPTTYRLMRGETPDPEAIEKAKETIGQHTVNIVGYRGNWKDNIYQYYIYDCNYPGEIQPLVVTRFKDGTFEYRYRYAPMPADMITYSASSSYSDEAKTYTFQVQDDQGNFCR